MVGTLTRIGQQLGINAETLRNWVSQAEVDEGYRPGITTDDAPRPAEPVKEVRKWRRANPNCNVVLVERLMTGHMWLFKIQDVAGGGASVAG